MMEAAVLTFSGRDFFLLSLFCTGTFRTFERQAERHITFPWYHFKRSNQNSNYMSVVKAKFRCYGKFQNGYNETVQFHAVYGNQGDNADFSSATPSGSVMMNIDKETKAADLFEPGKDYYLTFEKAPDVGPVGA